MSYYCQNDYKAVPYPHRSRPGATVASSGCGVCCVSMVVEGLTGQSFPPGESAAMAIKWGARAATGTDMGVLSRRIASHFDLKCRKTSDTGEVVKAAKGGAWAIANISGDRPGYTALLSSGGHYVAVRGVEGRRLILLDPGYYPGKFSKPGRRGRAVLRGHDILVTPDTLELDCLGRSPRYYIFEREDDMTRERFDAMMEDYLARRASRPASPFAQEALCRAQELGITDGLRPGGFASREEAVVMIMRALELAGKK